MQNKTKIKDKSVWRTIFSIAKWLILVLMSVLLYYKFFRNATFSPVHFLKHLSALPLSLLMMAGLFSCLNWSLETMKWRILLKPFNPLPFGKALSSILSGVTISQLLPYKTGEYLGRMLYVKNEHKLNAALLSVIGSYSQLLITLLFGTIGFFIIQPFPYASYLIWTLGIILLLAFGIYYTLPGFHFQTRLAWLQKLQASFDLITRKELLLVLGLSFLRYVSFLLPYAILAKYYGLANDASFIFHLFAVACIFFMQTVFPNFILTDIALRLAIPVIVFSGVAGTASGLEYVPGMVIYLFNVAVPMMAGALVLLFAKFRPA